MTKQEQTSDLKVAATDHLLIADMAISNDNFRDARTALENAIRNVEQLAALHACCVHGNNPNRCHDCMVDAHARP